MGLIKPLAWVCKETLAWVCKETLASIPWGGLARVSFSLYLGSEKCHTSLTKLGQGDRYYLIIMATSRGNVHLLPLYHRGSQGQP